MWLAAVLGIAILATVAAACTGGEEPAPEPPTATPSPTAEATPSPSPSPTATAPASPTAAPSPTPSATATPTPTATATSAATPTVVPSPTPTPIATPEPPLVAVSPAGEAVPRLATVRVAFRNPPALADGASLVRIDPPIEGSFAWADERTLLFQPDFPGWHRGQSYRLIVSAAAAGLD